MADGLGQEKAGDTSTSTSVTLVLDRGLGRPVGAWGWGYFHLRLEEVVLKADRRAEGFAGEESGLCKGRNSKGSDGPRAGTALKA